MQRAESKMPSSYSMLLFHCMFHTEDNRPCITDEVTSELYPYFGGIIRSSNAHVVAVGGTEDHVHLLLRLPTDMHIAEAMRLLKCNSSKWVNTKGFSKEPFRWQKGFSVFTVSASGEADVVSYIRRQREHHMRYGYAEELMRFLEKHGVSSDEDGRFSPDIPGESGP
jgi:REP-associated tyrosine transposase